MYQAKSSVKNFSLYWDRVPPLPGPGWGTPPYLDLDEGPPLCRPGLGTPLLRPGLGNPPTQTWTWDLPTWTWTWDPPYPDLDLGPPPKVNRQTFPSINITFPCTPYTGGKNKKVLLHEHKRHTACCMPLAWTQEAHCPPRSKCSLCWWGRGKVSHPVLDGGGVPWVPPSQVWTEGYPIQSWMGGTLGTPPFQVWMGGTPSSLGWGVPWIPPVPGLNGGYPIQS